ncbi:hypothetical protein D3C74_59520 [compost metagenome]
MVRRLNWLGPMLVLILITISLYSLYSSMYEQWVITPPNYVTLISATIVFLLSILSFQDRSSRFARFRSWLSTILSFILIFALLIVVSFTNMFSGSKELMTTSLSPDGRYTIHIYKVDAGAMGTYGIVAEQKGPLWFKKHIYYERRQDQVVVEWENSHTIRINSQPIDLQNGPR